jgi:polar amino acid transport system permease protein
MKDHGAQLFRLFLLNMKIALVAQAVVLVTALIVAVVRQSPGRIGLPFRVLAIAYIDLFRGIPLILLVLAFNFGLAAARVPLLPNDPVYYGTVAIIVCYTAYVAEVYRAGIESVHTSQVEAARSLGMSYFQSLRLVVVPQAVRRVIPPLLNDFIALTKDTALVFVIGVGEALKGAQDINFASFSNTGFTIVAFYFVLVTIPLARFVDVLIARQQRRSRRAA